jgi:predicted nucleic acid-binding protein
MSLTSDRLVVDASVVVKWFISGEVLESQAMFLHRQFSEQAIDLFAPNHLHNEVASAITFASRGNSARLSPEHARILLGQALRLEMKTVDTSELLLEAFDFVHRHSISIYDALYLSLAVGLPAPLVTSDARFYREVRHDHDVRWLGDFPSN